MTRTTVHLLRHGEVHNPDAVLYGRLPGFRLSDDGQQMAVDAAQALSGRDITAVVASPLQRAQETARPTAEAFGLEIHTDERLIESENVFEGKQVGVGDGVFKRPQYWHHLRNPFVPSWGEPYDVIARRMLAAAISARDLARDHEAVCVSHQLPIWTTRRYVEGRPLWHRPDRRQCGLASLTSITWDDDRIVHVTYSEPAGAAARRPEPARSGLPHTSCGPCGGCGRSAGRSGGPGPYVLQLVRRGWPERRTQWRAGVVRPAAGAAAVAGAQDAPSGPGPYVLQPVRRGWPGRRTCGRRQPMVFWPSSDSRRTSAWPACCAVSAMTCSSTRRTDHDAPGGNHGASGSGCALSRSGWSTTSWSVRAATRSYSASTCSSVSSAVSEKPSAHRSSSWEKTSAPCRANWTHCASVAATCFTSPPRQSALTVVRCRAWSSVSPRTVTRRKERWVRSVCSRSERSSGVAPAGVAVVVVAAGVLMECAFRVVGGCAPDARDRWCQFLT